MGVAAVPSPPTPVVGGAKSGFLDRFLYKINFGRRYMNKPTLWLIQSNPNLTLPSFCLLQAHLTRFLQTKPHRSQPKFPDS
jgi:hypothetical protein